MELSPSDKRIKQLMEQCGYPNSMSLYQAFKQFEMEIRLECKSSVEAPILGPEYEIELGGPGGLHAADD